MRILFAALAFAAFLLLQPIAEVGARQKEGPGLGRPPVVGPGVPAAATQPADEVLLKTAHVGNDGPALVEFFKKRIPPADAEKTVNDLVKQLGDKEEATQRKAEGELIALGPTAVAALRQAANGVEDKAAAARARQCLQQIEGAPGANLVKAVARTLGEKKPAGAAEALLAYLPFAEGDGVVQEIETTLAGVALKDGKPDPFLFKALEDKQPVVRATAAEILCQVGGPAQFAKVRPLLKDEKPTVRLRVALALAAGNDGEAIPVLIENLGDLQPAQLKQAEEVLNDIAGDYAIKVPQGNDAVSKRLRRDLWQTWWKSLDGKLLTEEMRSRTLSNDDYEKAKGFIKQLSDGDVQVRDKASTALVAMGPAVLPLLRQVNGQPAAVQVQAAAKCVQLIEKDTPNPLPYTAPRLLVLHQADKALETLLNYLPFAENESVVTELIDLIASAGFKDGKPSATLLAALEDKVAARRAAAVVALTQVQEEWDGEKTAVRKMLKDEDSEVRLRASQALIGMKDKEAVPELINLFADLPPELAWEAEDLLSRMAGAKNPNVPFAADAAARTKCKDAWAAWWKDNSDKVELVRSDLRQRALGYTLIVEAFSQVKGQGRIVELDQAGKVRWQIEGLAFPTDAQVLPGDRVLIPEQNGQRVTERDRTGKVLWEKNNIGQPFVAHRERNGNTFIATRNVLMEVDRNGKDVFSVQAKGYVLAAIKLRDGQIAYVTNQSMYYRVDSTGKELKTFRIPNQPFGINFWEVLPNDHVMIVTMMNQPGSKIIEFDADGKQVWEASVQVAATPTRLPNGNTLVPTNNFTRIVELDRNGKVRSEMKDLAGYQMFRVSRR